MNIDALKTRILFLLKNRDFQILLGILILAFILRLWVFVKTLGQPLWYDEAAYFSYAKTILGQEVNYPLNPRRPFFMPLLWVGVSLFGGEEAASRFLVVIISMFGVLFTYLIGKEMYNKRVGWMAAFMMSVFWIHLFFTGRLLTGLIATTFIVASVYFFWKGYVKKDNFKMVGLAGLFFGLAVFTRAASVLMVLPYAFFFLTKERLGFLKKKSFWSFVGMSVLAVVPFILWLFLSYENPVGSFTGVGEGRFSTFTLETLLTGNTWSFVSFFPTYLQLPYLALFVIGLGLFLSLLLGLDYLFKKEGAEIRKKLFLLIWIVVFLVFFGMATSQSYMEPRYLMYIFPAVFIIAAIALERIYDLVKKHDARAALIVVLAILVVGAYFQLAHAASIIDNKAGSYDQVKDAGLWLNENSDYGDIIYSASYPLIIYYADRPVYGLPTSTEDFEDEYLELGVDYIMVSIYERHDEWMYTYFAEDPSRFEVVYVDTIEDMPSVVIYEVL